MNRPTPSLLAFIFAFSSFSFTSISHAKEPDFDSSIDFLMQGTITGAVLSFGFACYKEVAPCTLDLGIEGGQDRQTISLDKGQDNTIEHLRIAYGVDWKDLLHKGEDWTYGGRWDFNLNLWQSSQKQALNKSGLIIGLSPVFRLTKNNFQNAYFELGAGPHLLDNITVENEYKSTQFQFGNILGFGWQNKRYEFGYRYIHISNANIEIPNPGTDFHNFHIAYRY